jgi:hypothetical protein
MGDVWDVLQVNVQTQFLIFFLKGGCLGSGAKQEGGSVRRENRDRDENRYKKKGK